MGLGKKLGKSFHSLGKKISHTTQSIGTKIDKGIDAVAKGSGKLTNGLVKGTGIASRILDAANMAGLGAVTGGLSTQAGEAMKRAHQGAVKIDNMRDEAADKLKQMRMKSFNKVDNTLNKGVNNVAGKVMAQVKTVNNIGAATKNQIQVEKDNMRKKADRAMNQEIQQSFA